MKKIRLIIIAVLSLAIIAIIGVATLLMLNNEKPTVIKSNDNSKLAAESKCQSNWQDYRQEILGIAFCYPAAWGKPTTKYIKYITRLSGMKETFATQNIYYDDALNIIFDKNSQVSVILFNNQYSGKSQRGIDEPHLYYDSGITQDVVNLINGGNICDYKVEAEYKYDPEMMPGVLKTIYAGCENGVKSVLTQHKEVFDFDNIGTKYTYSLQLLSFKKLSNGYFDNALINRDVDRMGQINEELTTLNDFFNKEKTGAAGRDLSTKTKVQFNQEKQEFAQFISTITTFKPVPKIQSDFQSFAGEDPNITSIRKYYWLIATGKLDEAYAMYADKAGTNFDQFKKRYGDAYSAEPFDLKNTGKNQYEFHVKYQDHNSPPMEFRVKMNVDNNIVRTVFLEEYLTDVSKFGDMTAYSARRGTKNYVFLNKDGKEITVDQGDAQYDSEYKNLPDVKHFSEPQFSPNGNYLTYSMTGWEWRIGYIYDIQKNKIITGTVADELLDAHQYEFTADEKYFYLCSSSRFGGSFAAAIYSVPGFNAEYDAFSDPGAKNFYGVECAYDKNNNSISFKLSDYEDENNSQSDKTLVLRYNLTTKKVED